MCGTTETTELKVKLKRSREEIGRTTVEEALLANRIVALRRRRLFLHDLTTATKIATAVRPFLPQGFQLLPALTDCGVEDGLVVMDGDGLGLPAVDT